MLQKQNPKIGARPGTLAIPPGSPPPRIIVVQYDAESVTRREIQDIEALRSLRDPDRVTWVDIQGFGDEARLRAPQVCFVVGRRYLLTFQERYFGFFDPVRERIQDGIGPLRHEGPDYLAYALIDAMIDRYYPVAQELSDRLEELEDIVVEKPHPAVLARIHSARRQLVVLRRVGWPQREAISSMLRERTPYFGDRTKLFLRDTSEHIAQIMELIDSSREMASDLAESYLSNVSHRTNEIMKVLTLWPASSSRSRSSRGFTA